MNQPDLNFVAKVDGTTYRAVSQETLDLMVKLAEKLRDKRVLDAISKAAARKEKPA